MAQGHKRRLYTRFERKNNRFECRIGEMSVKKLTFHIWLPVHFLFFGLVADDDAQITLLYHAILAQVFDYFCYKVGGNSEGIAGIKACRRSNGSVYADQVAHCTTQIWKGLPRNTSKTGWKRPGRRLERTKSGVS